MNINRTTSNGFRKRWFIVLSLVILAAILVATGLYLYNKSSDGPEVGSDGVNYSPATDEDRQFNDSIKQDLVENKQDSEQPAAQTDERRSVRPVITAWGQPDGPGTDFKLNGYVPKIIESDGRCTLTMTKDGQTVTESKHALQNAQNTSCGQLSIPFDELEPGSWTALLSYTSDYSEGKSKVINVEVK